MAQAPQHPELHGRMSQFEAMTQELEGRIGGLEATHGQHHTVHGRLTRAESSHKELLEQAERVQVLMGSMQALDNGVAENVFGARMKDVEAQQMTLQRSVDNLHKQVADAEVTSQVAARMVQLEDAASKMEAKAQALEGASKALPHKAAQALDARLRDVESQHQELHAKVPVQLAARTDHIESMAKSMQAQAAQLEEVAHAAEVAARLEKLESVAKLVHDKALHLEGHAQAKEDHHALSMRIASFEASHAELHSKAHEIHHRVAKMEGCPTSTRALDVAVKPAQPEELRGRAQATLSAAANNGMLPKLALEAARITQGSPDGSPLSRQPSGSPNWSPRMQALQQQVSEDVARQMQDLLVHLNGAEERRKKLEKNNQRQAEQIKGLEETLNHALAGQFGQDVAKEIEDLLAHLKAAEARRLKLEQENREKDSCIQRLERKLDGSTTASPEPKPKRPSIGFGACPDVDDEDLRAREREVTNKLRARLASPPGSPDVRAPVTSHTARELAGQLKDKLGQVQKQHASMLAAPAPRPKQGDADVNDVVDMATNNSSENARSLSLQLKNKLGDLDRHHTSAPARQTLTPSKSVTFKEEATEGSSPHASPTIAPVSMALKSSLGERSAEPTAREEELLKRCEAERQMRLEAESEAERLLQELCTGTAKANTMQRQHTDQTSQINSMQRITADLMHKHAEAEVRAEEYRVKAEDAQAALAATQQQKALPAPQSQDTAEAPPAGIDQQALRAEINTLRAELQNARMQQQQAPPAGNDQQTMELKQQLEQAHSQISAQQQELERQSVLVGEVHQQELVSKQTNQRLTATVQELQERLKSSGNTSQEVARLQAQVEAADAQAASFQKHAAEAQQAVEQFHAKVAQDQAAMAALQEELLTSKRSAAAHEAEIVKLQSELLEAKEALAARQAESARGHIESRSVLEKKEAELAALQQELRTARSAHMELQAELAALQQELRTARSAHMELQEKSRDLEVNVSNKNQQMMKDLEEELARTRTDLNVAQANVANLEVRCSGYETQFSRMQVEKKEMELQVMQLQDSLATAQQQQSAPPTHCAHSASLPHGTGGSATAARAAAREATAATMTAAHAGSGKTYKKLMVPGSKVPGPGTLDARINIPQTSVMDGRKSNVGSPGVAMPATSPILVPSEGGSCSMAATPNDRSLGDAAAGVEPSSPERRSGSTAFPFPYNATPLPTGSQGRADQQAVHQQAHAQQRLRLYAAPTSKPAPVQSQPVPTLPRAVMGVRTMAPIVTAPVRPAHR